jgi:aspartate aminotransferase
LTAAGKPEEAQAGDVVLFHGCCHNPTGIDPTLEQWQQLAKLSVEKGWLPLFDFAYQGFRPRSGRRC